MAGNGGSAGAGPSGAILGLGFIGALVYFWQQADTFWQYVLGFLEALVWPAFLVYDVLDKLH